MMTIKRLDSGYWRVPIIRPIYNRPIWCPENTDGSYSWPVPHGWIVIRRPADIPAQYARPRDKRSFDAQGKATHE